MTYGLHDTKDDCWLGNADGPLLYDDELTAKIAARVLDVRLGNPAGQTRATEYQGGAESLKDELEPTMDAETAMQRLEDGWVL